MELNVPGVLSALLVLRLVVGYRSPVGCANHLLADECLADEYPDGHNAGAGPWVATIQRGARGAACSLRLTMSAEGMCSVYAAQEHADPTDHRAVGGYTQVCIHAPVCVMGGSVVAPTDVQCTNAPPSPTIPAPLPLLWQRRAQQRQAAMVTYGTRACVCCSACAAMATPASCADVEFLKPPSGSFGWGLVTPSASSPLAYNQECTLTGPSFVEAKKQFRPPCSSRLHPSLGCSQDALH